MLLGNLCLDCMHIYIALMFVSITSISKDKYIKIEEKAKGEMEVLSESFIMKETE